MLQPSFINDPHALNLEPTAKTLLTIDPATRSGSTLVESRFNEGSPSLPIFHI
jgi:hypothetical protein